MLQLIAWSSGKAFAVWDGVASYQLDGGVTAQRPAFAIGVLPDIYTFHRYTGNSSLPYRTQARPYPARIHR